MQGCNLDPSPPTVLRGRDSQTGPSVGLHWFRGSFLASHFKSAFEYLTDLFGEPEYSDFGLWYYDACMTWPNKVKVRYHTREDRYHLTEGRFALECPGEALAAMEPAGLIAFLKTWDLRHEISVSRLDERFLDFEWLVAPRRLYATVCEFDLWGGQIKRDYAGLESILGQFPSDGSKLTKEEVDFGKRGSDGSGSYLRVYNKKLESDGQINAACWELESSGPKARVRFRQIMNAIYLAEDGRHDPVAAATRTIGQHIGGCIDFLHRDAGDKNLARCPRYAFWEQILERLGGRLTWFCEVVEKTVDRARSWVERQVVPNLQMLKEAFGLEQFLDWLLNDCLDGRSRLRSTHRRAIGDYQVAVAMGRPDGVTSQDGAWAAVKARYGPQAFTADEAAAARDL